MDVGLNKQINKTRLKICVLQKFQEAQEQHDGKNTIIVFEVDEKYAERSPQDVGFH